MKKNNLKFSVIIPTYNRADHLKFTLETCTAQSFDSVEFIVQDDASTDHTAQIVQAFASRDSRFKYINSGINGGMRENFEKALKSASGEYLLCLGGDDALLPEALTELSECVSEYPSHLITWPTASFHYSGARSDKSQLIIPHEILQKPFKKIIESSEYFIRQTQRLFYVSDPKAPMLYVKSCVPLSLIRQVIKVSDGRFFQSSTPDGYSSFALASLIDEYIYTNKSFTMHGVSPSSAGLNYVSGKGDGEDYSAKFFRDNRHVPMAPQLAAAPYSPLISLMTADFIYSTDNLFKHGFSDRISIDLLIKNSIGELSDGLFATSKIKREIDILSQIAKFHKKSDHFDHLYRKARSNSRKVLEGDAISIGSVYLEGGRRGLNNVFDAANFVKTYQNSRRVYAKLYFLEAIFNSIEYKMQSYRYQDFLLNY